MNEPRRGLLDSTQTLLDTALGLLQTRIALFATEIEQEKARLLSALAFGAAAYVLLSLGAIFLALTLTVIFWDDHRQWVLGLFTAGFLSAGGLALFAAARNTQSHRRLLSATLAELDHDRDALRGEKR